VDLTTRDSSSTVGHSEAIQFAAKTPTRTNGFLNWECGVVRRMTGYPSDHQFLPVWPTNTTESDQAKSTGNGVLREGGCVSPVQRFDPRGQSGKAAEPLPQVVYSVAI
jgi:hypothetical protein